MFVPPCRSDRLPAIRIKQKMPALLVVWWSQTGIRIQNTKAALRLRESEVSGLLACLLLDSLQLPESGLLLGTGEHHSGQAAGQGPRHLLILLVQRFVSAGTDEGVHVASRFGG